MFFAIFQANIDINLTDFISFYICEKHVIVCAEQVSFNTCPADVVEEVHVPVAQVAFLNLVVYTKYICYLRKLMVEFLSKSLSCEIKLEAPHACIG